MTAATNGVLEELIDERARQVGKHGDQAHLPNGTGGFGTRAACDRMRQATDAAFALGNGDWSYILFEEVYEAIAESEPAKLRAELVQVAAVAVAWIEAIDRNAGF